MNYLGKKYVGPARDCEEDALADLTRMQGASSVEVLAANADQWRREASGSSSVAPASSGWCGAEDNTNTPGDGAEVQAAGQRDLVGVGSADFGAAESLHNKQIE